MDSPDVAGVSGNSTASYTSPGYVQNHCMQGSDYDFLSLRQGELQYSSLR